MVDYKTAILANPQGMAWKFATQVYDLLHKRAPLEFEMNEVLIANDASDPSKTRFRDGEVKPTVKNTVRKRDCFFIHDSNAHPSEWFTQLLLVNLALRQAHAHQIIDILPYMRFARQDRKEESGTPISCKGVADVIGLYADGAITIDIHNRATEGNYSVPIDNLDSFPVVIPYLQNGYSSLFENLVVLSPDTGGARRVRAYANKSGIDDIVIGDKVRTVPGQVASYRLIGSVKNKNVLAIDDMLDSGGTAIEAAEASRSEGALEVYLYITHGLFTKGIEEVVRAYDRIFVGDTLQVPEHPKIEVISFAGLFAEAIYRTQHGISLSELFRVGR